MVLSRDTTVPNIDMESIYFYGSGNECQPVGVSSAFYVYMFPVTSCGTMQFVRPTTFFFNRLTSLACLFCDKVKKVLQTYCRMSQTSWSTRIGCPLHMKLLPGTKDTLPGTPLLSECFLLF